MAANVSSFLAAPSNIIPENLYFLLPSLSEIRSVLGAFLVLLATYLVYEQHSWRRKKASLPGREWTIPIIGDLANSLNPSFDGYLASWVAGPMLAISVLHKFIIVTSTGDLARKILNTPTHAEPCLIDSARTILSGDNWVFLSGKAHTDYRKGLNVLFTRRALGIYLPFQEDVYRRLFKDWLRISAKEGVTPFQMQFRELNMQASLRTFCGEYIPVDVKETISQQYYTITAALQLVNFPFAWPGTKVYKAVQARKLIVKWFEKSAQASRKAMEEGKPVTCLVDAWIKEMIDAKRAGVHSKEITNSDGTRAIIQIRDFTDEEIAGVLLSFVFASQDATTSGSTWTFQLLADHPDVLEKVREEQLAVRNGDINAPLSIDMVDKMTYTRYVIKEMLRLRPPVLMVPYQTKKDWPVSEEYTAPKGSMIIPSFWMVLHDENVYPNPDKFDPMRWSPSGTAEQHPKSFMPFGFGTHYCLGREYAVMHMMASVGLASLLTDWKHEVTKDSEKIVIMSTTYPADACRLEFTPRNGAENILVPEAELAQLRAKRIAA